ncbi:MAG: hypothetical protein MR902_05510 [Campylobacter sp.]|nr:hypothetical protein [Campylobacter sp.]
MAKHFCKGFENFSAVNKLRSTNQTAVRLVFKMYSIDISANKPKLLKEPYDIAISMGCGVKCPYIGREFDEDWRLDERV